MKNMIFLLSLAFGGVYVGAIIGIINVGLHNYFPLWMKISYIISFAVILATYSLMYLNKKKPLLKKPFALFAIMGYILMPLLIGFNIFMSPEGVSIDEGTPNYIKTIQSFSFEGSANIISATFIILAAVIAFCDGYAAFKAKSSARQHT